MIEFTSDIESASRTEDHESLSLRIVDAVAEAEGVDPVELDPLYGAVDPDAIDAIFSPQLAAGSVPDASAEIRFEYHGYEVRATATGRVSVVDRRA